MVNKWYSIEKTTNGYTVWQIDEETYKDHGSYGSKALYTGAKKDCIEYCKNNKIKVKGEKNERKFKIFI